MNILFVYSLQDVQSPAKPLQKAEIQFGISYISAVLRQHGHQTKIVVLSKIFGKNNFKLIDTYVKNFSPRLICLTAVFSEYRFIDNIAHYLKSFYRDIYLLIGGVHASLNPAEVIMDNFDALCIGEGEHPTLELAASLENGLLPSGILNLWFKRGTEIERNPTRPFIDDLDSLPFPDREMWQEWIGENPGSRQVVLPGRGCLFECTYCCNHALRKVSTGSYVRHRSPDNIVKEIEELVNRFPTKREIYLEIESLYSNKEWAMELCLKLEDLNIRFGKPLSFGANLRITNNMDLEDIFPILKKSNFKYINIGLESGSERIRREVLKRYYSNQDIINAVKLARKYGLKIRFYNMIGIPHETLNDFRETVRINRICLPDQHYTGIFFPYPGTDLYFLSKAKGLLDKTLDTEMERTRAVLELPKFSARQIEKSYEWFDYYVYKGYKPLYKILLRVVVRKFTSRPYINYLYSRISRFWIFKLLWRELREY